MAVAIDVLMTAGNQTDCNAADNGTSNNGTGITVGAAATVLVVTVGWGGAAADPTNRVATWNGVSMTEAVTVAGGAGGYVASIFILGDPASGDQALNIGWTTTADCYAGAASFSGTSTTTADAYASADNETLAAGADTTPDLVVTSTTDGATVAMAINNANEPTVTGTKIFGFASFDPGAAADYQIGGTSNTHTFTFSGGTVATVVGIHLVAGAGGGAASVFKPDQMLLMGVS